VTDIGSYIKFIYRKSHDWVRKIIFYMLCVCVWCVCERERRKVNACKL